ncbi:hypothetical protein G436_3444 [Leptospira interrogans serovar Hardjo str. Norma]|uniref:Uncharacterized protein n=1 Tax=Leptospira interrogans serovar Hardjo str. Norma TaxID=1279460 RepID=A0A0M3TMC3_LEPIR|nr:hypothetical protein G436_3444 [Leptospira interrogans serovar Hardjo str. Norma]
MRLRSNERLLKEPELNTRNTKAISRKNCKTKFPTNNK